MFHLLSYPLNEKTPLYGDTPPIRFEPLKRIRKGDSCDTTYVSFCTHSGTHVDVPSHFAGDGRTVTDFEIGHWVFDRPLLLDRPKKADELVGGDDLTSAKDRLAFCDLLLIRTGFFAFRGEESYRQHNPGLSPSFAEHLREFPNICAIGIDSLSITPFQNRPMGREVHRMLLDRASSLPPLMIIEDLNLSSFPERAKRVFVIPLLLSGLDGSPVTVFAESE